MKESQIRPYLRHELICVYRTEAMLAPVIEQLYSAVEHSTAVQFPIPVCFLFGLGRVFDDLEMTSS